MQTLRNRVSVDTIVQIVSREEGIFLDAKASASSEEIRDVLALFERRAWSVDFGDGVRPDLVDQEAQDLAVRKAIIVCTHWAASAITEGSALAAALALSSESRP
eukprot:CAMPEP_0206633028 /NCGR_PEP_ID=MMETSP0325_2-20121206/69245_1 /ASSEMBLY_ACC=CAM_ASM_000347 /TAXON_ID=2866 /ORGANISM="Crypthecodinium cohnii, Strain Seligo" /LENGTH=103 /DNA_ID=CAMNT_0054158641 /DNA_START=215 /DNA_END=527 /DNA_ORIENTATION=+